MEEAEREPERCSVRTQPDIDGFEGGHEPEIRIASSSWKRQGYGYSHRVSKEECKRIDMIVAQINVS